MVPVTITFDCTLECHNRERFQAEGHFVPGSCTGPEVYALNLCDAKGNQILRVMSSNEPDLYARMRKAIREHVWTSGQAATQRAYTYEQFQSLVNERGQLAEFLAVNYGHELLRKNADIPVTSGSIAVAIHFLREERKRWRIRLRNYLTRAKVAPAIKGTAWLPDDWRKD